ncbi:hypothetical protein D3C74_405270 [compost metagenome]
MAYACSCFNHRHGSIEDDILDQSAASARDDDVEEAIQLQHLIYRGAVRIFNQLQGSGRD